MTHEEQNAVLESWRDDLTALVRGLVDDIEDDYRAPGCEDDEEPSMCLTVGTNDEMSGWSYQTGDNSFTGSAYGMPHWAVVTLTRNVDEVPQIVDDILDQLAEALSQ